MTAPNAAGAGRANDRPRQDQTETNPVIVRDLDVARKEYAMPPAQAALPGSVPQRLDDGTYTLSRPGAYREPPTLREVGDMLRRMGAAR